MLNKQWLTWNIREDNNALIIDINGNLTRNTLFPLWEMRCSFLDSVASKLPIYWNLENISKIDSAGFALLVELINFYSNNNITYITIIPKNIKDLVILFGLEDWLSQFKQ